MRFVLFLAAMLSFAAEDGPKAPKAASKEIGGEPALTVLMLHFQAAPVRGELERLNRELDEAVQAACKKVKSGKNCRVTAADPRTKKITLSWDEPQKEKK